MKEEPKPNEAVSVDEMMERLRDKRRESEGRSGSRGESRETLTRSDGSKVVRVRRRSSQRKKQKNDDKIGIFRNTWMLAILCCILVIGVGGVFALYLFQNARLNSPDFAKKLASQLEESTGASYQFDRFELVANKLRCEKINATWPRNGIASSLSLEKIQGEVAAATFLHGQMTGESISSRKGQLVLTPSPRTSGGGYGEEIPNIINFSTFRCDDLNIFLGPPNQAKTKFLKARASLEFEGPSNSKIFLQGGNFISPLFGATELRRALIEFYPDQTKLSSLTLLTDDIGGKISLQGTLLKEGSKERVLTVDSELTELNTLVQGRLLTVIKNVHISARGGRILLKDDGDWKLQLKGKADGFDLTALPIMSNLGILVEDNNLSATQFKTESDITLEATPREVRLKGLHSERRGLFAITCDCEIYDGNKLRGTISVGLSPRYTERTNFMAEAAFNRSEGPYRWCDVKISGHLDAPTDDSTERFRINQFERDEAAQRLIEREIIRQRERKERMNRARGVDDRGRPIKPNEAPEGEEKNPEQRFEELTR